MKKIMVLGAGRGQVPIINLCKASGFITVVASIPGDYPGIKLADIFCEVDITDKESVLEAARKETIDGIIADQIDIAVPTAAYVAEKMGLAGITYDCALKFTNKFLMKNECQKLNIKTSEYYRLITADQAREKCREIGFPVVIKPTDSAGSKGVSLIRNEDELETKFDIALSYSGDNSVIVEKYIQGREYLVEGFASDFTFTNLAISEREYFDIPDLFIPKKTIYGPYMGNITKERILEINRKLVEGFGLKFGITHSEYLVDEKTGDIYLGEIAARGGGTYISSDILPMATGIDFNKYLLDIVAGKRKRVNIENIENNVAGYICFSLPPGYVREIEGIENIKQLPCVYKVILETLHVGMQTGQMKDKSGRMGPILIKGKNTREFEDTVNKVKSLLDIKVETSEGIKGIIW